MPFCVPFGGFGGFDLEELANSLWRGSFSLLPYMFDHHWILFFILFGDTGVADVRLFRV